MESRSSRRWTGVVSAISLALAALLWARLPGTGIASAQSLPIVNLTVHGTDLGEVRVEWDTPAPATTLLEYDLVDAPDYLLSYANANLVTHHVVDLSELQAKRVYRFKVTSSADGYDDGVIDNSVFAAPGYGLTNPDWQSDWLIVDWPEPIEDEWLGRDWAAQLWATPRFSHFAATVHDDDTGSGAQLIRIDGDGDYADAVCQSAMLTFPQNYVITGRVRLGPLDGGGEMSGFVGYSTSGDWDFENAVTVEVIDETAIADPLEGSEWQPFAVTFTSTSHPVGTIFLGGHRVGGTGPGEVVFDDVVLGLPATWTHDFLIDFFSGSDWHLISLPVAPVSLDWETVLDPYMLNWTLYRYDPARLTYVGYQTADPTIFGAAQYGVGAWWNLLEDSYVSFTGCIPDFEIRIPLSPRAGGWVLLGHPFPYPVALEDCFVYNPNEPDPEQREKPLREAKQAGWIGLPVFRYSNTLRGYVTANLPEQPDAVESELRPWFGYWVNTNEPGAVLIIPPF